MTDYSECRPHIEKGGAYPEPLVRKLLKDMYDVIVVEGNPGCKNLHGGHCQICPAGYTLSGKSCSSHLWSTRQRLIQDAYRRFILPNMLELI